MYFEKNINPSLKGKAALIISTLQPLYSLTLLFKALKRLLMKRETQRKGDRERNPKSLSHLFACFPRPAHLSSRLPLISDKIAQPCDIL